MVVVLVQMKLEPSEHVAGTDGISSRPGVRRYQHTFALVPTPPTLHPSCSLPLLVPPLRVAHLHLLRPSLRVAMLKTLSSTFIGQCLLCIIDAIAR
jgi:hypothetical protein